MFNPERTWKEAREILRGEIRMRHRISANREIEALEARVKPQLDWIAARGIGVTIESYDDVMRFVRATKTQLSEGG